MLGNLIFDNKGNYSFHSSLKLENIKRNVSKHYKISKFQTKSPNSEHPYICSRNT